MEKSKKTARANPEPPDLTQPTNILQKLLDIELKRLDIAVRIENERNIVFPETTVIIHDIIKIEKAITEKKDNNNKPDVINKKLSKKEASRQIINRTMKERND